MAKRKTRQQKIIADLRRQLTKTVEPINLDTVVEKKTPIKQGITLPERSQTSPQRLTYTNPYLINDLRKTAILTSCIIVAQFFLFFLLRQHILILPGISY